jgi:hypothetical protein
VEAESAVNTTLAPTNEASVLHDRLTGNADYAALAGIVDEQLERVLSQLERGGHTLEVFESLAGELRGLRASRGASTVTRGRR